MFGLVFRFIRLFAIALTVLGLIFGVLTAVMQYEQYKQDKFSRQFSFLDSQLDQYKELAYQGLPQGSSSELKRPAKVAVYCLQTNDRSPWPLYRHERAIDPLMLSLPSEWLPTSASEVTTLVVMQWAQQHIGTFTDGSTAYQEHCRVDVIDLATKTISATADFAGGEPPTTKRENNYASQSNSGHEKVFGTGCEASVLDFLEQVLGK